MKTQLIRLLTAAALCVSLHQAAAQGTAFTYQGRLNSGTNPANGSYDLTFALYNASTAGGQVGSTLTSTAVGVTNGLFTVVEDFGSVFNGTAYWLQIGVRTNGGGAFAALSPRQALTPEPYAVFAEGASAAGITGTVPNSALNPDVALLDGNQTFTGLNSFSGNISFLDPTKSITFPATSGANSPMMQMFASGTGNADRMVIAHSPNYPTWGLQYQDSVDNFNFLSGGTPVLTVGLGSQRVGVNTVSPQSDLSVNGSVNIDQASLNTGTSAHALTFGSSSGEGIGSIRTTGYTDSFGLNFYTDFANRLTILQNGNVGIGTTNPAAMMEVHGDVRIDGNRVLLSPNTTGSFANDGLYYDMAGLPGINNDTGPFLGGFYGGALGALAPNTVSLSWDSAGNAWVNNNLSTGSLTVRGNYLVVNGGTPVLAYIGDDGSGNDVQIGSQKAGVTAVSCFNTADNAYMHLYVSSITINGGSDLAEPFQISTADQKVAEGAVVVIDEENPGRLKLSDHPYDTRVAGVVSGANGINPGIQMQQQGLLEGGKNVALTGRVYVQADTTNGTIKPGDLLTTSNTPGRAMRVSDHFKAQGAILGKAMSGLKDGRGMVLVLVTLQ
jgi:hypothetical protein